MAEWMNPQMANMVGAVLGASIGAIGGGVGGPMIGTLAPKGKAKGLVVGFQCFFIAISVVALVIAVVAFTAGQPRHVVMAFGLPGAIGTAVMGGLLPVTLARYREAEARKLQAEEFRRG